MALTVLPVVLFNNATGSDTAASGAGPGTAITGTAAAHTNGSATTAITFTNSPDLSGVAQDGSALLALYTGGGVRHYTRISTVDNTAKTCVVEDTFNIAAVSAVNYAIGGKKKTIGHADSLKLWSTDNKAGWTAELQDAQSISATLSLVSLGDVTTGSLVIRGVAGGSPIVITQTANIDHFTIDGGANDVTMFTNVQFVCSNATRTNAHVVNSNAASSHNVLFRRCIFGDATNKLNTTVRRTTGTLLHQYLNCEVKQTLSAGIVTSGSSNQCLTALWNWIHDCASHGISLGVATERIEYNLIEGNGGSGISISAGALKIVHGNTIHGNTGDGISATSIGRYSGETIITNNSITQNGGFGVNCPAAARAVSFLLDYNNFGTGGTANTSGAYANSLALGAGDLTVDPQYTNAGADNFEVGTNLRAKGFPSAAETLGANMSATNTFVDIGAAQREEQASGSKGDGTGMFRHINRVA